MSNQHKNKEVCTKKRIDFQFTEENMQRLADRIYFHTDFFTSSDAPEDRRATIEWMMGEITEGQPEPFSVIESYRYLLEHTKDEDKRRENERDLRYFAEVQESTTLIGKYEFTVAETIRLRNWLNTVIEWHQKRLAGNE